MNVARTVTRPIQRAALFGASIRRSWPPPAAPPISSWLLALSRPAIEGFLSPEKSGSATRSRLRIALFANHHLVKPIRIPNLNLRSDGFFIG
jgi:hypothetical protein